MTAMDLQASYSARAFAQLIARESDTIERKTGVGVDPMQAALVAMSNGEGGVIFVGVRDDGEVIGRAHDQGADDKIHEAALSARDVGRYIISEVAVANRPVIAIQVRRREEGFAQTSDGRVLVRRGGRNVALYGADLANFIQRRALRRFELSDTGIVLDDADSGLLGEVCAAFAWSPAAADLRDRLVEQGLLTREGTLTIAGALFLTDRLESLRQNKAIIEVRRYPNDGSDYDRRVEFAGPLHHQVRDATRFVVDELGNDVVVTGLYRHEVPRLPEVVVREAVANAVAHRSYEIHRTAILITLHPDRVTVSSPGGLPEPVTVATLRQAQAARNQDVIDVLRRFRLAEDAGRGIDVMEDTMRDALLDPPKFVDDGQTVRVELSLRGPITPRERAWVSDLERRGALAPGDRLLLVHAARGEALTNRAARSILGVNEAEARRALRRLRDEGLFLQRGERGGATYALVDSLAPPAAYRMSRVELADLIVSEATHTALSNERVRELTGLDRRQALALLQVLVSEGRLRATGSRRGTRYVAV